jgi:hypothetical protein
MPDDGLLPPSLGTYFCFFSAGFKICGYIVSVVYSMDIMIGHTWKEQSKLSSTLIIAPALSNSPQ